MEDVREIIKSITDGIDKLESLYEQNCVDMSTVDAELSDIYHYIEFNNLDACGGYKAYKDLHDCLKRRREIKDENGMLLALRSVGLTSNLACKAKKKVETKERQYKPRVRKDLFK